MSATDGRPRAGTPLEPSDPRQVGPYSLLSRLGHGGMGMVYLGRTPEGHQVAVKVILPAVARDPAFRARFRREATNARRVRGFCTAAVLDADPDSDPAYIVTDFVPGPNLTTAIEDGGPLPPSDLEQLAINMATALTVIHRAGVIHRDLKPSNVLLSPTGARVIDFGIARALDATTMLSRDLGSLGTPAFMAPEQIRSIEPTPAIDIFAWGGVVVYAATGRLPFGDGPAALLPYRILHEEPQLDGLPERLRGIVAVAMSKDPAARPTAAGLYSLLVDDPLGAGPQTGGSPVPGPPTGGSPVPGTADEPTHVTQGGPGPGPVPVPVATTRLSHPPSDLPAEVWRPPTTIGENSDRAGKSHRGGSGPSRRKPVLIAAAAGVAVVVAIAAAVLLTRPGKHAPPLDLAAASRTLAAQATAPSTDKALSVRLAVAAYRLAPTPEARRALLTVAGSPLTTLSTIKGHTNTVYTVAFSPDGKTLATASGDGSARLWDISDPRKPVALATIDPSAGGVPGLAFSPNGKILATGYGDNSARLWDISDRRKPVQLSTLTGHTDTVYIVAFSPDGKTLATGSLDTTLRLWDISDPRTPHALITLKGFNGAVYAAAFSPDGKTLAGASSPDNGDGTLRLWDVTSPASPQTVATLTGFTGGVYGVTFSPDSRTLATAGDDSTPRLWDVTVPSQAHAITVLTGHTNTVYGVAFSPDGATLASTGLDHTTRLWDISNPYVAKPMTVLTGDTDAVYWAAFSPDGKILATASNDHTARLWDVDAADIAVRACARPADRITQAEWTKVLPKLPYRATCG